MSWMTDIFRTEKPVIGMIHLRALPGSSGYDGDMNRILSEALESAENLDKGGVDAIMVENFFDAPFDMKMETAQITALAAATALVKARVGVPVGVDAAFCDHEAAFSCALAAGADFVRLAVYVDTVVGPTGVMNPCAAAALRYRKAIGAEHVKILADVQVKYTHMLSPSVSLEESAGVAAASGADGIIVTGKHTGGETPLESLQRVKKAVSLPVVIGSGFKIENANEQLAVADGAIVGTSLNTDGKADKEKIGQLMDVLGR